MTTDSLGLWAVLALLLFVVALLQVSRLPVRLRQLIQLGLLMRAVGAFARHTVLVDYYGRGDALAYFREGLYYAPFFQRLEFGPFFTMLAATPNWWGTKFVALPTGLVLSVIGPTLLGGFLAFSLLAFVGLGGFGIAFHRSYPHVPVGAYLRWIWLLPSLWFWPSSIGKEALVLAGVGLAMWGFVGKNERINWALLGTGIFLIYAIRPQVATVTVFSLIAGQWFARGGRWTPGRVLQGVMLAGVGLWGISSSLAAVGAEGLDLEGVQSYLATEDGRRVGGASQIDAAEVGLAGVPLALVNVLFRPFPWELTNPMMLAAGLEIVLFWTILIVRHRRIGRALREIRSSRLLVAGIVFIFAYSIPLGMVTANLGIIARQRIFVFPFLFLLLEARMKPVSGSRAAAASLSPPAGWGEPTARDFHAPVRR